MPVNTITIYEADSPDELAGKGTMDGIQENCLAVIKDQSMWFRCISVTEQTSDWRSSRENTVPRMASKSDAPMFTLDPITAHMLTTVGDSLEAVALCGLPNDGDSAIIEITAVGTRTDLIGDSHYYEAKKVFKNVLGVCTVIKTLREEDGLVYTSELTVKDNKPVLILGGVLQAKVDWVFTCNAARSSK